MRRLLFLLLTLLLPGPVSAATEPFASGLLWEISRPGMASSYLFGTMHTADQRLLILNPAVEKAFAGSRSFVLEMYPDEATARRFSEAGELPAGQQLSALLPEPAYAKLQETLTERGIAASQVDRYKPWAALLRLTETRYPAGHSLDTELYARARAAGKTIEELESVEEQIAVFDDLPDATQLALLAIALRRHHLLPAELELNIAAYRRGDLGQLMQLARQYPGASGEAKRHLAVLEKKVIRDRSVVMAYRLQTFLRRGGTFAAVGALHLYGRHGMLQLLRDDGWTVRRRD